MSEIRIFPNSQQKEFKTPNELQDYLVAELGDHGKYYYRSNKSVAKVELGTMALFRFADKIIGCGSVIQGPRKAPYIGKNNVKYAGYLMFNPESLKVFPHPLLVKDLEKITGKKFHFKDNYNTGRSYQRIPIEYRDAILNKAGIFSSPKSPSLGTFRRIKYGRGGEGEDHKRLKEWIAKHPEYLYLKGIVKTEVEAHVFPSGDLPDIVFTCSNDVTVSVEIETDSPIPGAYQAIKYKSLLCAERKLPLDSPKVRSFLVAYSLTEELKGFCDTYGIETVEKRLAKEGKKKE